MNDKIESLVVDILRKIQGDISALREGQNSTNQRLGAIEHHMAGVEHHMAGFHLTTAIQTDELALLKRRIARIESRLEIDDPGVPPGN